MRALKILVGFMSVMIVGLTVAVVYVVVQRLGRAAATLPQPDMALHQPVGTKVTGIAGVDGKLAVWVERPDGTRLLMVDPSSAKITAEIRLGE